MAFETVIERPKGGATQSVGFAVCIPGGELWCAGKHIQLGGDHIRQLCRCARRSCCATNKGAIRRSIATVGRGVFVAYIGPGDCGRVVYRRPCLAELSIPNSTRKPSTPSIRGTAALVGQSGCRETEFRTHQGGSAVPNRTRVITDIVDMGYKLALIGHRSAVAVG